MRRNIVAYALITVAFAIESVAPESAHAQSAVAAETSQYEKIVRSAYGADEPGAAVLVAKGGEIVFLDATGMADLELEACNLLETGIILL